MEEPSRYAPPEQLRYARVLGACVHLGFVLLVLSFVLYMLGIPPPRVPVDKLPQYWGLPVDQFIKVTRLPTGWAWLGMTHNSDMRSLTGIAVLAGASAVSSLAVLPIFTRRRELALLAIVLLQLIVLVITASNVLAGH
jgi:hypothetical protein